MNKSLLRTLTISTWITAAIGVLAASTITVMLILKHADDRAKERIRLEEANLLSLGLTDLIALNEEREVLDELPGTIEDEKLNEVIRIYEPTGHMVYTSAKLADLSGIQIPVKKHVDGDFFIIHGKNRQYMARIKSYKNVVNGVLWVEISTPRMSPEAILYETAIPSVIILILLMIAIFFSARLITERILKPLLHNVDSMNSMNIEQMKSWEPLSTKGQYKEFVPFIAKVNDLIARIQGSIVNSQYMGRYIAHEIRTPLTIIQGEIENALNEKDRKSPVQPALLESVLEEVEKIKTIINTILRLSTAEQKSKTYDPQELVLKDFFPTVIKELQNSTQPSITLSIESPNASIFADRELMKLFLSNLLRNIEKHAHETSSVDIVVREQSGTVLIELSDQGPGLPLELIAFLNGEEKYAHDKIGIGLVLCKQIAEINGFDLRFSNLSPKGLLVKLSCPTYLPKKTK